jgi:MFS family permease
VLQTASINAGMMIAGRFFAGAGCGILLTVVPIYIAEASPPQNRGMIVGLQGMMIATGFFAANWIGYGGAYAKGNAQWRIPLAMQIPGPLLLVIGCCFIPYSPRWCTFLLSVGHIIPLNRANCGQQWSNKNGMRKLVRFSSPYMAKTTKLLSPRSYSRYENKSNWKHWPAQVFTPPCDS